MGITHAALFRRRILVAEDSFLLAIHVADVLEEAGAQVVGPVATIDQALELAASMMLDGAVYNSLLRSTRADPLAALLDQQRVPSVVLSLTPADDGDPLLRDHSVVQWPFDPRHLIASLADAMIQRHHQDRSGAKLGCRDAR